MIDLHQHRYPYTHDKGLILKNFTDSTLADDEFDPVCLRGKYWEFIKEDIAEAVKRYNNMRSQSHTDAHGQADVYSFKESFMNISPLAPTF
ncbi:hypothetical protein [Sphingobacterium griseoflavum]